MVLSLLSTLLSAAVVIAVELDEDKTQESTTHPYPIAEFSSLLPTLNTIDLEITKVLGSLSPDKTQGDQLISNLQEYVFQLGPLVHHMMFEEAEVLMAAKSVYRQGAPRFMSTPVNREVVQQAFGWDETQMTVLQALYDNTGKTWRNFLNMCERQRIES
uniref:Hemerythrin-like domain-containing protein n=1 Tax=Graphocephala atropunctata TaxID=36148 RepID=A0A1B6M563_9HEMI